MANTTLRAYLDDLNLLLEQEAQEEVIGHCRHILQHYPKNVETYRMLGRALLDRQRFDEANDVFQRVLGAIPDDFVAHLGLSSVAEEQGNVPTALWHAECAYEQDPNNNAIKDELKRLYEKRDGTAPERIQMTRGALVRTYFKSRLYDQAAQEARTALRQTPERIDLVVLLAQIFWEGEHPVEAGETALQVLETLPDCLEANRILAALWIRNGRPAEAAPFMARLEQLDPFMAWETAQPGKPVPDHAFQLPHLDWDARAAAALATDVPDWVNTIGNVFEAPDEVALSNSSPNWFGDEDTAAPPAPPKRPSSRLSRMGAPEPEPVAETPVEMPDWAADFLGDAQTPPTADAGDDIPDWFKDTPAQVVDNALEGMPDMPDWFAEAVSTPSVPPVTPLPDSINRPVDQLPSGFTDLLEGNIIPDSTAGEIQPASAADIPDWLTDEFTSAPTPPAAAPAESPSQAVEASWLMTGPLPPLDDAAPAQPPAQAPAEASLDWLNEAPAAESPATVNSEDFNLDWLGTAPESAQPAQSAAPVSDMDWLNDTASPAPAAESTDLSMDWLSDRPAAEAQPAANIPAWLSDTPAAPEPAAAVDDQAWLSDMASPAVPSEPAQASDLDWLTGMPSAEPTAGEPTPDLDWLGGTAAPEPTAEAAPADTGLDWLNDMPSVEAPAQAEPTAAAGDMGLDWLGGTAAPEPTAEAAPADTGLDWLNDMPSVEAPAQAEPTAAAGDMGLDWLGSTPTPEPTAEVAPADTGLDWLNDMPSVEAPAQAEPTVEADDMGLDWLGSTAPEPAAEAAPADTGLDWLNSMPSVEAPAQAEPTVEADDMGLDWLGSTAPEPAAEAAPADTGLDWLNSMPSFESAAEAPSDEPSFELGQAETAEPEGVDMGDPMAWLRPYQADSGVEAPAVSEVDEQPLAPAEQPDWLSAMAPTQATSEEMAAPAAESNTLDWLTAAPSTPAGDDWLGSLAGAAQPAEPAPAADQQPEIELEDEWLAAFEMGAETPAASAEPSQGDETPAWQMPAEASPVANDWLNTLTADNAPASTGWSVDEPAPQPAASDDWLGSLNAEQPAPAEAAGGDDWLASVGTEEPAAEEFAPDWTVAPSAETEPDAAAQPAAAIPTWMMDAAPSEASASEAPAPQPDDHFDRLLRQAAEKANEPRVVGETGILNPDQVPDWMAAFGGEGEPTAAATIQPEAEPEADWLSASFGAPASSHEPEPASTGTPDWLADMAPVGESAEPILDDLDFGAGDAAAAEPAADTPDWLAAMAPGKSTAPAAQPVEELDFSSLDFIGQGAPPQAEAPLDDFNFEGMFDEQAPASEPISPVAQPTNLMNTSGDVVQAAQPEQSFTFDFSFNRQPAWMRKKGAAGGHTPRWMKKADSSTDKANDLPDWLKE